MLKRGKLMRTSALVAVMTLALFSAGVARADHVRVEFGVPHQAPVVQSPPVVQPVLPSTIQAEVIEAHQVRAQTIYANKIEADEIQGAIHQTSGVKINSSQGKIRIPTVLASVIYADEIKANSVVADVIYVRKLERR
jgi:hypothetical protein